MKTTKFHTLVSEAALVLRRRGQDDSPSPLAMGEGRGEGKCVQTFNCSRDLPRPMTAHMSPTMAIARQPQLNPGTPAVRPSPWEEGRVRGTTITISPALLARSAKTLPPITRHMSHITTPQEAP
jgi:hypothetical protein